MGRMHGFKPEVYPRKIDAEKTSVVTGDDHTIESPRVSRRTQRQMDKVVAQERAKTENRAKNKLRVQQGKKTVADPGSVEIPSIWEKIAEPQMYQMFRETGSTGKTIDKFQRKRVLTAVLIALMGIPAGLFVHVWLYLAGPILGFAFYKLKLKGYVTQYRAWKFERAMNFSKFTRLVIPYLKASGGTTALYTIFNKILRRTEKEADRNSLYKLMGEMGDDPSNIQPFLDYAERSSGSDMSFLFMSTIFDYQQSTSDVQVINELGRMAGDDMMDAIDEIITMKLKRFVMFPTKVVLSSFILVAGLGAGLMLDNFKDLDLSGATAPVEAAEEGEAPAPAEDAAVAPVATPDEEDAVIPENETDWLAEIQAIANDGSLTGEARAIEVNELANTYEASDDEARAFGERVKKEFDSGLYKEALTNDEYMLSNLFTSKVLVEKLKIAPSQPLYVLALGVWENTHNMYADGISPDNPAVLENERGMTEASAALD